MKTTQNIIFSSSFIHSCIYIHTCRCRCRRYVADGFLEGFQVLSIHDIYFKKTLYVVLSMSALNINLLFVHAIPFRCYFGKNCEQNQPISHLLKTRVRKWSWFPEHDTPPAAMWNFFEMRWNVGDYIDCFPHIFACVFFGSGSASERVYFVLSQCNVSVDNNIRKYFGLWLWHQIECGVQ